MKRLIRQHARNSTREAVFIVSWHISFRISWWYNQTVDGATGRWMKAKRDLKPVELSCATAFVAGLTGCYVLV